MILPTISSIAHGQTIRFREVAVQSGVPGNIENGVSAYGHGVITADINNDGLPDIYISNAVRYADHLPETLYLTSPNGYFECDKARGVDDPYGWTGSHGICFFDYDNDGDYDIFNATTDDRNRLYQNDGNAFFKNVTDQAELPLIRIVFPDFDSAPYGYGTRGVVAFDANGDGFLDLLAVNWGPAETRYDMTKIIRTPPQPNEFYINNRNGTFRSVTNSGLTHPPNPSWMGTQGVAAADIDNDGDLDVLIVHRNYTGISETGQKIDGFDPSRQVPNQLMINDGTGKFTDETIARGLFDALNDANGTTLADYDNDGDLDIFIPPKAKTRRTIRVYRNRGNGYFDDLSDQVNLTQWGFSTFLLDADNDGDLDIIAPRTRDTTIFYRNRGNGTFEQLSNTGVELYNYDPRGGAAADFDNDGDLDLYIADANKELRANAGNRFFRNELSSSNRWLKIGGRGPKGDMGGFGTKIWVFERGRMDDMSKLVGYREVQNAYGYLCQDDPVQHFGLGLRDSVEVKVKLLDGTLLKLFGAPAKIRLIFSKPAQAAKVGGDKQSAPKFAQLPQPLEVRVTDAYQQTVYGARVIFSSNDPTAQFRPNEVYSDRTGIARVWYILGSNALQTVTAFCEASPSSQVTFSLTAIVSTVSRLEKIDGDNQQGQGGYPLPQKLIVRAIDDQGQGVSGITLVFAPSSGSGLVDGLARLERPTAADGRADVQWTLGSQPSSVQTIDVFVKDHPEIRQRFQALSFGLPAKLVWESPRSFVGRVNTELPDSLSARVTDDAAHFLREAEIVFEVLAGGGLVDGQQRVTRSTNAQGRAGVRWRLGRQAGIGSQTMRISAKGLQGSPVTVTADAFPGPANRLVKFSGDGQTGIFTQPLPEPLVVRVTDEFDNPIAGHPVTFTVTQGDGSFGGMSLTTVETREDGTASARLTLGRQADCTVRAVARNESGALNGSPAVFKLRGTVGPPAPENSEFSAPDELIADGRTRGVLRIVLRDIYNNPISGMPVEIQTTGTTVALSEPPPTDSLGQTSAFFTAVHVGRVTFLLMIDRRLFLSRTVDCTAGPPALSFAFGDRQMQHAGMILPQPIAVLITDALQHPIAGLPVLFAVIDGGGSIVQSQPVVTSVAGIAESNWRLGRAIGKQHAEARIEGMAPVSFTAEALPIGAVRLSIVSGDRQILAPNQTAPDSLVVQLIDSLFHPLPKAEIIFSVEPGEADGVLLSPARQMTNENGKAAASYRSGTNTGLQTIRASSNWGTVQFKILVRQNPFFVFQKLSPDSLFLPPHAEIDVIVRMLDGFGSPAAGEPLLCTLAGGGELLTAPPYFTAPTGIFAAKWRLGAAGLQTCEIRALNGSGSALFTMNVTNRKPTIVAPAPLLRRLNIPVGEEARLLFAAEDADGEKVDLHFEKLPIGATGEAGNSVFYRCSPQNDQIGDYLLKLVAADPHGAKDSLEITLQVTREPFFFPLAGRMPENPLELLYGQQATFLVEPVDSTVNVAWQVETERAAFGTSFTIRFSEERFLKPDIYIAAQLFKEEYLQVISWKVHLKKSTEWEQQNRQPALPTRNALLPGYPNPFNPTTTIGFVLSTVGRVRLEIYDLSGRHLRTLIDRELPSGEHQAAWDGRDEQGNAVGSGVYFCRMQTENFTAVQKLTLMK